MNPLYYAMRFIDGLCEDIKSVVHMHRRATLDFACVPALLQEELVDPSRQKDSHKVKFSWGAKQVPKGARAFASSSVLE